MDKIIEKELSYKIVGALISVRREYGLGHKERIYQEALAEELQDIGLAFKRETSLPVLSTKTGRQIGTYRPDFIIENKVILELEVFTGPTISRSHRERVHHYLKRSNYKVALVVNYGPYEMKYYRIVG